MAMATRGSQLIGKAEELRKGGDESLFGVYGVKREMNFAGRGDNAFYHVRVAIRSNKEKDAQAALKDAAAMLSGISFKVPDRTLEETLSRSDAVSEINEYAIKLREGGYLGKARMLEAFINKLLTAESVRPQVRITQTNPGKAEDPRFWYVWISCMDYSVRENDRVVKALWKVAEVLKEKYETAPFEEPRRD
jgi:hypothetical protein